MDEVDADDRLAPLDRRLRSGHLAERRGATMIGAIGVLLSVAVAKSADVAPLLPESDYDKPLVSRKVDPARAEADRKFLLSSWWEGREYMSALRNGLLVAPSRQRPYLALKLVSYVPFSHSAFGFAREERIRSQVPRELTFESVRGRLFADDDQLIDARKKLALCERLLKIDPADPLLLLYAVRYHSQVIGGSFAEADRYWTTLRGILGDENLFLWSSRIGYKYEQALKRNDKAAARDALEAQDRKNRLVDPPPKDKLWLTEGPRNIEKAMRATFRKRFGL